ncbi:dCTP deaminase [Rhizobium leguminosarum]|uniref:dCTP deaminase n=1 Tax=Rhizobium leguminosarum TaxID=384 RepID=UPI003F507A15
MILSGTEIDRMVQASSIVIEPYHKACLEPNSYGFHLGADLIEYHGGAIDPHLELQFRRHTIGDDGFLFIPGRFYLGHTYEVIGGIDYASELYANLSTAMCGVFIQTSAPLGHTGAVIRWTLEITVAQAVRLYPRMRIGKVCFWENYGEIGAYGGRYTGSSSVVPSRIIEDRAL